MTHTVTMKHWRLIYAYLRSLGASREDAQDMTQETCIKAPTCPCATDNEFRSWLVVVAKHCYFTHWRHEKVMQRKAFLVARPDATQCIGPLRVEIAQLLLAIKRLPPAKRDTIVLLAMGEEYEDIARLLGVPVGTVKSRSSRAREGLLA